MRVQRFSTDWHANSFAGSTVRKITRGMWALDLLNDTILMALLPSLAVLLGSMILLGLHWPSLGARDRRRALRLCADDRRVFDALYRARRAGLQCLGHQGRRHAGRRPDLQRGGEIVRRRGARGRAAGARRQPLAQSACGGPGCATTTPSTAQLAVLLCLRASVIGGALLLWIAGRASPGDVTYVLTSYYIIHAYLRDVGMHINNLQRSVNDMEELVAIHDEAIGIADAPDAKPIDIHGRPHRVRRCDVPLRRPSRAAV